MCSVTDLRDLDDVERKPALLVATTNKQSWLLAPAPGSAGRMAHGFWKCLVAAKSTMTTQGSKTIGSR